MTSRIPAEKLSSNSLDDANNQVPKAATAKRGSKLVDATLPEGVRFLLGEANKRQKVDHAASNSCGSNIYSKYQAALRRIIDLEEKAEANSVPPPTEGFLDEDLMAARLQQMKEGKYEPKPAATTQEPKKPKATVQEDKKASSTEGSSVSSSISVSTTGSASSSGRRSPAVCPTTNTKTDINTNQLHKPVSQQSDQAILSFARLIF